MAEMESATGNEFLDTLLARTPPAVTQPRRGQNYNYPTRLYLLPDGRVVELQGDPQNRAYYQDKGYHMLSEAPGRNGAKSELRQYVEDEYPKILKDQIEKAQIINAIRRAVAQDRNVTIDEEGWDLMTVAEMRDELQRIRTETGKPIRVVAARSAPRTRADLAETMLLRDVETTDTTSIEEVAARTGQVPNEGYDPLTEARRPRRAPST